MHLEPGLLCVLLAAATLAAQDGYPRKYRLDFSAARGTTRHDTGASLLDGDTDGDLLRLRFEGIGRMGLGGGLRVETWRSDDELFVGTGFPAQESSARALYGHFSYRVGSGRFLMPVRLGAMLHRYELENVATSATSLQVDTYCTRFEVEPEFVFSRGARVEVSAYAGLGIGAGLSTAEDATGSKFDTVSTFWFAEVGARARYEFAELGLAFVTHGMSMTDSDLLDDPGLENFGAGFAGLMLTAAIVF
ncbi:MAG: hypothetical protein KDC98_24385 [Planctomycetes bacterium]|nr:hypothetical protein [Planctomycetota bacterium]